MKLDKFRRITDGIKMKKQKRNDVKYSSNIPQQSNEIGQV